MKKILIVLSVFLGLGFLVCIFLGFWTDIPFGMSEKSVFSYRFLTGLQYFIVYLPMISMTGYVISCAVYFGHNPEGSTSRFSKAMVDRFKIVMITAIIIAAVLTLSSELLGLFAARQKAKIINQPKLVNDYVKVGDNLYSNGYYDRAIRYADAALKLDPNCKPASKLRDKADLELNRAKNSDLRFKLYQSVEEAEKVDRVIIDAQQINEVYQYYVKAQEAFDKKEWFNAHYFAEVGIGLATPKDPNLEGLKKLSTQAWNNLEAYHNLDKTKEQKAFDKKYQGYLALVQKDDLKAYYIFRELYQSSREFQSDPDVVFYLQIAENRINERSFFIDETLELESFESANDVYFAYSYADGSKDIIYIKGVTNVEETGNSIQYLRSLTVVSIDRDGDLYRTMTVPYAKVLPVSTKTLNATTKSLMGIDDKIEQLPYIMLRSVSRDVEGIENFPLYTYATGDIVTSPEYMLLAIPYQDFLMMENSTNNLDSLSITTLFKLAYKAAQYGYSAEVFGQVLMNRLFYPLWIIIVIIVLGTFAWNNRVGLDQYFKFSWLFAFPFFFLIGAAFYKIAMFFFKLMNYVLLGGLGITKGLTVGFFLYLFILIIDSVYFLARRSKI
ncbi:MAG: hypothetical protein K6C97_09610 [Treponema sp.]|nr:hypothetical protein [Treponema sp.]